jgi:hypothetical protein
MDEHTEKLVKILQEDVGKLAGKVAYLEHQVETLYSINRMLTVRLCELDEGSNRTIALLDAMRLYKKFMEPEHQADAGILDFRRRTLPFVESGNPLTVLILGALQGRDAGVDRLDALREWQTQATVDELSDDIRELLQKLLGSSVPNNPDESGQV